VFVPMWVVVLVVLCMCCACCSREDSGDSEE